MDNRIEEAKTHFEKIVKEQLERVERMKKAGDWVGYTTRADYYWSRWWGWHWTVYYKTRAIYLRILAKRRS